MCVRACADADVADATDVQLQLSPTVPSPASHSGKHAAASGSQPQDTDTVSDSHTVCAAGSACGRTPDTSRSNASSMADCTVVRSVTASRCNDAVQAKQLEPHMHPVAEAMAGSVLPGGTMLIGDNMSGGPAGSSSVADPAVNAGQLQVAGCKGGKDGVAAEGAASPGTCAPVCCAIM